MPDLSKSDETNKTAGVHYAYPAPVHSPENEDNFSSGSAAETKSVPLEDLMSKLKNL